MTSSVTGVTGPSAPANRNGRIIVATSESSAVETAASVLDRPVRDVLHRANAAAVEAGLVPGGAAPAGGA